MNEFEKWKKTALELGFDVAEPCDVKTLIPRDDVRDMCAVDKCRSYNKNWTCPPACGTIQECGERMQKYPNAIILQSVGHMTKDIDSKCYRETGRRHMKQFYAFAEEIRREYPEALVLGAGGCGICKQCAYPEPCRFPEKACSSMEAYGLMVTQVCRDNNVPYHHGERTITYSACVLY